MFSNQKTNWCVTVIFLFLITSSCIMSFRRNDPTYPIFPMPAPPPSSSVPKIELYSNAAETESPTTLGAIDSIITSALEEREYTYKYFAPENHNGFVIVTRLERYLEDGSSAEPEDRWNPEVGVPDSFLEGLLCPFHVEAGYYRIMVFVVTDTPYTTNADPVTREEAEEWLHSGANMLPHYISEANSSGFIVDLLIYEYKKPGRGQRPVFLESSNLTGYDHLEKSGVGELL